MPLDFPSNPTNGQIYDNYYWDSSTSAWRASGNLIPLIPSGIISQYVGSIAPVGWLLCEGQELLITSYQNLYSILTANGTVFPYGTNTNGSGGAGSTHFRLPDLRGDVVVGKAASGTFQTLGATGGTETVTLTSAQIPAHSHPNTLSSNVVASSTHTHSHISPIGQNSGNPVVIGPGNTSLDTTGTYDYDNAIVSTANTTGLAAGTNTYERHRVTSNGPSGTTTVAITNANNTGGGSSHTNLQPYIVLNYIIKT